MNAILVFLLGIGTVVVILSIAGLRLLSSRGIGMKLPGGNVSFVVFGLLVTGIIVDLAIGKPISNRIIDTVFNDPPVWVYLAGIGTIAAIVLFVFRRKAGLEALKFVAAAAVTASIFGFLIYQLDKAESGGPNCSTAGLMFATNISEDKRVVSLPGSGVYHVPVPLGREYDLVVEFADDPYPAQPSLTFSDISDFREIGEYAQPGVKGLTGGTVKLTMKPGGYVATVGNQCLNYFVYLESEAAEEEAEEVEELEPESE